MEFTPSTNKNFTFFVSILTEFVQFAGAAGRLAAGPMGANPVETLKNAPGGRFSSIPQHRLPPQIKLWRVEPTTRHIAKTPHAGFPAGQVPARFQALKL
jgi:hypothetical protein